MPDAPRCVRVEQTMQVARNAQRASSDCAGAANGWKWSTAVQSDLNDAGSG